MFFRNLTLFRFPTTMAFDELETQLGEHPLKPVGPLELSSRGFVPPMGRDAEALTHRVADAIWLTVGGEDKLLPGAVVRTAALIVMASALRAWLPPVMTGSCGLLFSGRIRRSRKRD